MQGIQFWPVCKGEGVWITHSGLSVGVNVGGGHCYGFCRGDGCQATFVSSEGVRVA